MKNGEQALAEFGAEAKSTIPDITELLNDKSADVRLAVLDALETFGANAKSVIPAIKKFAEKAESAERERAEEVIKIIQAEGN